MVVIQCPHCEEDIELEDDVYGLFDCPLCDEEFIWEDHDNDEDGGSCRAPPLLKITSFPLRISPCFARFMGQSGKAIGSGRGSLEAFERDT